MIINFKQNAYMIGLMMLLVTSAHAETDKAKYCPSVNQIYQNGLTLNARNSEGRLFSSEGSACNYCQPDIIIKPIKFMPELSRYNDVNKTLSCVYEVQAIVGGTQQPIELKMLNNRGDY